MTTPISQLRHFFIKLYFMFRLYLHGLLEMVTQPFRRVILEKHIGNRKYKGKVAFVTGGTSGIGLSVCRMLCERGMTVVAAGPHSFQHTLAGIEGYIEQGRLLYIPLHLESFQSIEDAVKTFSAKFQSLDYLINNAGVMLIPYVETEQGFEGHMGVNFLGPVKLTKLLLPLLNKCSSPRIVNVASSVHRIAPSSLLLSGRFLASPPFYSAHLSYALSKLAVILYTDCLANQLERLKSPILVNSVHPGVVATSLYRHVFSPLQFIQRYLFSPLFFRTVDEGAVPIMNCALSEGVSIRNGSYIENGVDIFSSVSKTDKEKLWQTVGQHIHKSRMSSKKTQ